MPGRKCTVCEHSLRNEIDKVLLTAPSCAVVAETYGLGQRAVERHRAKHIPERIAQALAHRAEKDLALREQRQAETNAKRSSTMSNNRFLERLDFLMEESHQYVVDAKKAVKMQKITVKTPRLVENKPVLDAEGHQVYDARDEFKEFRDVGAMAPALNAARDVAELFGTATGELKKTEDLDRKPFVVVLVPQRNVADQSPSIQSDGLPALQEPHTIDVKALGD